MHGSTVRHVVHFCQADSLGDCIYAVSLQKSAPYSTRSASIDISLQISYFFKSLFGSSCIRG